MSSYIPALYGGSYGNYAKSVYAPPRQELPGQVPSGFGPAGLENAGSGMLPSGRSSQMSFAEASAMPNAAGGGFRIEGLPQNMRVVPVLVDSDYATPGWGNSPYHLQASRIVNTAQLDAAAVSAQNDAALAQARIEYEQALQQVNAATARLSQLGLNVNAGGRGGLQQAPSMINTQRVSQMGGVQHVPSQTQLQPQQPQVRFGPSPGRVTPVNSDYRFTHGLGQSNPGRGQQQMQESVYVGIPNNSQYAGNRRSAGYNYPANVPRQTFNIVTPESLASEMNVRTAVMPENSDLAPTQSYSKSNLGPASSDYHFDGLRGMTAASENQSAVGF